MINATRIEQQFTIIQSMIKKMSVVERELLSDKLLAYLLFQSGKDQHQNKSPESKKPSGKKSNAISKKDQDLIKKIADKTDELYKRLGGDTI